MADQHLILETGGRDVHSRIDLRTDGPHTRVHIVSECDGHVHSATVSVHHRTGYTPQQAEFDIEQARWQSAQAAAGQAHIRTLLPQVVHPTPTPRRLTFPEHPKPELNESHSHSAPASTLI